MASAILVVPDNPLMLDCLTAMLDEAGYQVCGCSTPQQIQLLMQSALPQLVLLDLQVPTAAQAVAAVEQIRLQRATYDLPVIVYAAAQFFQPNQVSWLKALGCCLIARPVDRGLLLALIDWELVSQPRKTGVGIDGLDRGSMEA